MANVLIIFIIFALFPGLILGFIILSRYLEYRETVTMIEHGITPQPPPPPPRPPVMPAMPYMPPMPPVPPRPVPVQQKGTGRGTLIWGLVLSGVGLALTLALWPIGFIANSASGNTVSFPLGLGPWMLVGFVPLFVGLALILGFVIMRPERGPNPPAPFPGGEGGAGGAYSRTPPVPAEATVQQDAPGAAPPNAPPA